MNSKNKTVNKNRPIITDVPQSAAMMNKKKNENTLFYYERL